jgi:ATP-dependent DNA helicase PIF1
MAALSLDPPPELNQAQLEAKEKVLRGESVFVTGPGGTGKTVLLRDVCDELERRGRVVAVTASTGIAAVAIGGTTLHAVLGCGAPSLTSDFAHVRPPDKKRLRSLHVLVIDEISMVSGEFLDRADERLREVRGVPDVPFGGVQLLAIGDFLQLPPVSQVSARQKSRKGFCPALFLNRGYAFQARVWQELDVATVRLEEVFRQTDRAFVEQLGVLRLGQMRGAAGDVELRRVCDELNQSCYRRRGSNSSAPAAAVGCALHTSAESYCPACQRAAAAAGGGQSPTQRSVRKRAFFAIYV